MNFLVSTLVTVIFGVAQILCVCPVDAFAAQTPSLDVAVHSHQGHAEHGGSPSDSGDDHCDLQAFAITKSEAANSVGSLGSATDKTPIVLPDPVFVDIQVPAASSLDVSVRRRHLRTATPVQLKVRLLN
jgi:hypothetical protein